MRITISREEIHRAIRQYVRDYYKLEPQWSRLHLDGNLWYAEVECFPQSNESCPNNSRCPSDTP